jgi:hypothetical protein
VAETMADIEEGSAKIAEMFGIIDGIGISRGCK